MDRLDLELYADRLARDAQRVADELAAARLRLAWAGFEAWARDRLGADDCRLLEAVGALRGGATADDAALVERRRRQLAAIGRLQALVEEQLAELRRRS
jgi:hypothetical protein